MLNYSGQLEAKGQQHIMAFMLPPWFSLCMAVAV